MYRFRRLLPGRQLLLLLLLTLPAVMPLTAPGYFLDAHDAHHSIFFLVEFDQAIADGAWWPRWGPDHALGLGYPLWSLYAPLAYYVAELFHLLGAGFTLAVKLTWALATFVAACSMYALARRWWGSNGGLIAGLLCVYAPYHLVDMYVRAALAEYCALSLLPLVLLAFWDLLEEGGWRRMGLAALAYAAVILTHSTTALVATPLLGALIVLSLWNSSRARGTTAPSETTAESRQPSAGLFPQLLQRLGLAAIAVILAVGMSAMYLAPMLVERTYIVQEQWVRATYQYRQHFVYPHQFVSPDWGFGYAVEGPGDQMSFQLGLLPVALALTSTAYALRRSATRRHILLFFAAVALVSIWAMTASSAPLWDLAAPLASLIQFPWRLLSVTTLALAVLGGSLPWFLGHPGQRSALGPAVLALVIVLASFPFTQPQLQEVAPLDESPAAVIDFELKFPDMRGITIWASRLPEPEDSPLVAEYLAGEPLSKAYVLSGDGEVAMLRHGGASDEVRVTSRSGARVQLFTYWFPGWEVRVDGRQVEAWPEGPLGLLTFDVPAGQHHVEARMTENTVARRAGAIVSAASLAVVLGLLLWPKTRR